jgi:hypothetical protein
MQDPRVFDEADFDYTKTLKLYKETSAKNKEIIMRNIENGVDYTLGNIDYDHWVGFDYQGGKIIENNIIEERLKVTKVFYKDMYDKKDRSYDFRMFISKKYHIHPTMLFYMDITFNGDNRWLIHTNGSFIINIFILYDCEYSVETYPFYHEYYVLSCGDCFYGEVSVNEYYCEEGLMCDIKVNESRLTMSGIDFNGHIQTYGEIDNDGFVKFAHRSVLVKNTKRNRVNIESHTELLEVC